MRKNAEVFDEVYGSPAFDAGRRFDDAYRRRFRRGNFLEIKAQLGAFFHVA